MGVVNLVIELMASKSSAAHQLENYLTIATYFTRSLTRSFDTED